MSDYENKALLKILGPLELEVMKVIWIRKEATVQNVLTELNKQNDYAYTTIMTVMNRLDKKGLLRVVSWERDMYINHSTPLMNSSNKILLNKWNIFSIITEI